MNHNETATGVQAAASERKQRIIAALRKDKDITPEMARERFGLSVRWSRELFHEARK